MANVSIISTNLGETEVGSQQGRIQAVFEIGNRFWAHENWRPNFDRSTEDITLILFNSR